MGTSNWQNISWCVQAIMKIGPERVLDIGVGFGRWGVVLREFGEVWFDRVTPDTWSMHIEGIEGFGKNIAPYHEQFYDRVHVGDAKELLFDMPGPWSLAILGDVLEHFVKSDGERILDHLVATSDYVLINLPLGDDWPQEEKYENPYEEHKAVWHMSDFASRPLVCSAEFLDFDERPFASVILSREDPKHLSRGLFGSPRQGERRAEPSEAAPARLTAVDAGRLEAVEAIRRSSAWSTLNRLRNNGFMRALRKLTSRGSGSEVSIHNLGSGAQADGELRVLGISSDGSPILWDFLAADGAWQHRADPDAAFGEALVSARAGDRVSFFDYGAPIEIGFEAHPAGGACEVKAGGSRFEVDLDSDRRRELRLDLRTGAVRDVSGSVLASAPDASLPRAARGPAELSESERVLVGRLAAADEASLAVYVPGWTGIEHSTRTLFSEVHGLSSHPDREERERFLRIVEESQCRNLVLSGGASEHLHLVREAQLRSPETRIKLLWHGNFLQIREEEAWRGLRGAIQLAQQGAIHTLGFVKQGMAEGMRDIGLRAAFVENFVPELPEGPSEPAEGGPHIGCWISNEGWRKPPYAMAMATRRIEGAILHHAGESKRLTAFARLVGLTMHRHGDTLLARSELLRWMKFMHLNLYVTLSECCPMLPLESLSVGTPCLVGPNSHLFADDDYLREMLVVPVPDSSSEILSKARRALEEREAIVRAYAEYAPRYNARALASVQEFLKL